MKESSKYIIILLLVFAACSTTQKKSNRLYKKKFLANAIDKNPLGFLYQNDTLILSARFSECGEFGGHTEKISLHRTYKNEYFARIIRDSIDLDCPQNFDQNAIVVNDTVIKVSINKQKLVLNYLDKLYKRSTTNKMHLSNAADYFGAEKRGFSLYSGESPKSWKEFVKLRNKLLE